MTDSQNDTAADESGKDSNPGRRKQRGLPFPFFSGFVPPSLLKMIDQSPGRMMAAHALKQAGILEKVANVSPGVRMAQIAMQHTPPGTIRPFGITPGWQQALSVLTKMRPPVGVLQQVHVLRNMLLPANLVDVEEEQWPDLIDICQEDGISVLWAPRSSIVAGLLEQDSAKTRMAYMAAHESEILEDVEDSLAAVWHPEVEDYAQLVERAIEARRAGHWEAAQAMVGNVLNSAMDTHGTSWLAKAFPAVEFKGLTGSRAHLNKIVQESDNWADVTFVNFPSYVAAIGMVRAFESESARTGDHFNRHAAAHTASYEWYREEFFVPAVLVTNSLLRKLNRDLEVEEDDEEE
ncbi:hypothetical protein ACFV4E_22840 [Streptomyces hygroscopicus]|uniref:Uncharacterized protein n=1 Tax=Streptomyces hygroscopicus TaxID=1912 RepID=A0ABQ3UFS5_STRHY|nr:hypothetical protein [Streptomyces hygroscopicus]GHJ34306.1 hypothetical protein TPA0910_87390 [Streptomyces hygroscopicus]